MAAAVDEGEALPTVRRNIALVERGRLVLMFGVLQA